MTKENANGFSKIYQVIKSTIVSAMIHQRHGEVTVLMTDIPDYVSNLWREQALVKLRTELSDEYGITKVCYREEDVAAGNKAAIVVS